MITSNIMHSRMHTYIEIQWLLNKMSGSLISNNIQIKSKTQINSLQTDMVSPKKKKMKYSPIDNNNNNNNNQKVTNESHWNIHKFNEKNKKIFKDDENNKQITNKEEPYYWEEEFKHHKSMYKFLIKKYGALLKKNEDYKLSNDILKSEIKEHVKQ